jgi:hypothetical protein
MTFYARLKLISQSSREDIRALLFNPNLTSLADIEEMASDACIPASYVVAKLMKLNYPISIIRRWHRKVPSISALKEFIRELDSHNTFSSRNLEIVDEWRRSIHLVQMDITAHMSYCFVKDGIKSAYGVWRGFCIDKRLSDVTKLHATKLPSLWLLKQALKGNEDSKAKIVSAIMDWDENVLAVSQNATRTRLTMDVIRVILSVPMLHAAEFDFAVRILQLNKEQLSGKGLTDCCEMLVNSWKKLNTPRGHQKLFKLLGHLGKMSTDFSLMDRARLERSKAELAAKKPRHGESTSEVIVEG